ncbi:hypothetical protein QEH59_00895 [Coraliomargarita sp. SDUM461004]|uniref:Uncharacterized protein n=1 Tax=Thalassobacterium sedimentorum TaxID=3041258 RepID=A0ABU1ADZ3_9BACT|nr:hypothetical protein [Coraliomargarita sp. SDUM461004]
MNRLWARPYQQLCILGIIYLPEPSIAPGRTIPLDNPNHASWVHGTYNATGQHPSH